MCPAHNVFIWLFQKEKLAPKGDVPFLLLRKNYLAFALFFYWLWNKFTGLAPKGANPCKFIPEPVEKQGSPRRFCVVQTNLRPISLISLFVWQRKLPCERV